jgi:hypothetical protein
MTFVISGSVLLLALLSGILLDYPRAKPHERDRELLLAHFQWLLSRSAALWFPNWTRFRLRHATVISC